MEYEEFKELFLTEENLDDLKKRIVNIIYYSNQFENEKDILMKDKHSRKLAEEIISKLKTEI